VKLSLAREETEAKHPRYGAIDQAILRHPIYLDLDVDSAVGRRQTANALEVSPEHVVVQENTSGSAMSSGWRLPLKMMKRRIQ
jgi:hypothetical protein